MLQISVHSHILFLVGIAVSRAQELRPAVLVSNTEGLVRTEHVFIGYVGCNETSDELKATINKQNSAINELNQKFDFLYRLMINITKTDKFPAWMNASVPQSEIERINTENEQLKLELSKVKGALQFYSLTATGI